MTGPCSLAPGYGTPGVCQRCAGPLPPRRRAWCSDACPAEWSRHHDWGLARNEAIRRASVSLDGARVWTICDACGGDAEPPRARTRFNVWGDRVERWAPEVNHVEPRNGAGYRAGCHNHQTNLQVLCHPCHVDETIRQRRERPILYALEVGVISLNEAVELLRRVETGVPRTRTRTPGFDRSDDGQLPLFQGAAA